MVGDTESGWEEAAEEEEAVKEADEEEEAAEEAEEEEVLEEDEAFEEEEEGSDASEAPEEEIEEEGAGEKQYWPSTLSTIVFDWAGAAIISSSQHVTAGLFSQVTVEDRKSELSNGAS